MDSKAQRKALFRSKLRETSQKRERRIDSPLVRYNEDDQPVCRVCNATLKSESLWPAHQASRKHHEAIENIKAAAARERTPGNSQFQRQQNLQESPVTSTLPADFFDGQDAKKQKTEDVKNSSGSSTSYSSASKEVDQSRITGNSAQSSKQMGSNDVMLVNADLSKGFSEKGIDEEQNSGQKSQISRDNKNLEVKEARGFLPNGFFDRIDSNGDGHAKQVSEQSEKPDIVQLKQVKGALPEGFFDNRDEDLRARGIEPVKVDIDDAYKEFERDIQEDLQEVDDRLEEEEIDAAEVREGIESLEHKAYRERVEMVKKKLKEAKELRLGRLHKSPELKGNDSSDDSSSDDDVDEDFSVDWRAKRF